MTTKFILLNLKQNTFKLCASEEQALESAEELMALDSEASLEISPYAGTRVAVKQVLSLEKPLTLGGRPKQKMRRDDDGNLLRKDPTSPTGWSLSKMNDRRKKPMATPENQPEVNS